MKILVAVKRVVDDGVAVGIAVVRELDRHLGVASAVVDDDAAGRHRAEQALVV